MNRIGGKWSLSTLVYHMALVDIHSIYTHTFVYVCMLLIAAIISRLLRTDKYRTIQNCKIAMTQDASKHAISNFHIFSFHRSSSHHNAHTASRFPRLRGQILFRLFLYNGLLIKNLRWDFIGMRIALRKKEKKERRSTLKYFYRRGSSNKKEN